MLRKFLLCLIAFSTSAWAEKHLTFKVPEMHCQLCVYLVNKEVREVEGVKSTKASLKERKVIVIAESHVKEEHIANAIRKLNYTPEQIHD